MLARRDLVCSRVCHLSIHRDLIPRAKGSQLRGTTSDRDKVLQVNLDADPRLPGPGGAIRRDGCLGALASSILVFAAAPSATRLSQSYVILRTLH
jgi:hypothetical protein